MSNVVLQYANQYDLYNLSATSGYLVVDDGTNNDFSYTIPAGTFPSAATGNMIRIKMFGIIGQSISISVNVNGEDVSGIGGYYSQFSSEVILTYDANAYVGYTVVAIPASGNVSLDYDANLSVGSTFWTSDIVVKISFMDEYSIVNDVVINQLTIETAYTL